MFALRLKELREEAGYSQAMLARKLGVGQSTVGMWENGQNRPQNAKLEMLSSIFNVSTDYLLGRSDERNKQQDDVWALREKVRRDPERRILFDLARDADIEDVRQAVAVIDALKKTRRD